MSVDWLDKNSSSCGSCRSDVSRGLLSTWWLIDVQQMPYRSRRGILCGLLKLFRELLQYYSRGLTLLVIDVQQQPCFSLIAHYILVTSHAAAYGPLHRRNVLPQLLGQRATNHELPVTVMSSWADEQPPENQRDAKTLAAANLTTVGQQNYV